MSHSSTPDVADRTELGALITRYAHAVDRRDVDGIAGCFTADAHLSANDGESTASGRAAIRGYFAEAFTRPWLAPGTRSSHLLTNSNIIIDRDRARIETLALAVLAAPQEANVRLRGLHYSDVCQRSGGEWLISERSHRALWQCEAPGGLA